MKIDTSARLGRRAKDLRTGRGLRIADVAAASGLATSTISKVENGQMALTYDKLLQLARGLGIELVELLRVDGPNAESLPPVSFQGRRALTPKGQGSYIHTQWYDYWYLCTELSSKDMIPIIGSTNARTLEEFGSLIHHAGQEFVFALEGVLEVHTEVYAPTRLEKGDSMYFDSSMGHAYIAGSEEECRFLIVCSDASVVKDGERILSRPPAALRKPRPLPGDRDHPSEH